LNIKSIEELIEKMNYETQNKFELVNRNINESIDIVKQEVKSIIAEENMILKDNVKEQCEKLDSKLGEVEKVSLKKTSKI
jgi:DNA-binding transcriptional MerR regulator